jgi:hypothetical protein
MKIIVEDTNFSQGLAILNDLRKTLRQHADFDYRYIKGVYDPDIDMYRLGKAEFTFYNPADATAFSLKYL